MVRRRYQGGSGDIVKWFRGKVTRVEDGLGDALQESMDHGAEYMRYIIMTSGTEKSGKRGRIDTRKMLDQVESKVYPGTDRGNQTGRFGWLRDREDYFALQEGGFTHAGGSEVEGMYALQQAAEIAFQEFREKGRKAIDRA